MKFLIVPLLIMGFLSCTTDRSEEIFEYDIDTDGDGIFDKEETLNGTDKNNPCDPSHGTSYTSYDSLNLLWLAGDCDGDGLTNANELAVESNPYGDPIDEIFAVPEFLPKLSELNLFKGDLADLEFSTNVHEYELATPLYTDYAYKLRAVALPKGEKMTYKGDGLLDFPDNSILAKTFYYFNDERDSSLGKKIIETRVMIKKNGEWQIRNYVWNEEQTDAVLDDNLHAITVDWTDGSGTNKSVDYKVPSNVQCMECHNNNQVILPIGPKARALNMVHKGRNQLQFFKENDLMSGAPIVSQIPVLPDWTDESLPLENRARAYLDINCAHCHQSGGSYNQSFGDKFQFTYETSFEESNIDSVKTQIKDRMSTEISGYFMPLIGTSLIHTEGVDLIDEYIDSITD